MICPKCKAEYRRGFTRCADCDVELVDRQEGESAESETAIPGSTDDPFCYFWQGEDPRIHAEICQLLNDQNIPHKTIRRQDHLFNLSSKSAFQVGVPYSLFEKAEAIVAEAYGSDDERIPEATEEKPSPLELPESTGFNMSPGGGISRDWYPEDASVEVWSSDYLSPGNVIALSLSENLIRCRFDKKEGKNAIFVLPEDEARAREIVREVLEGAPPE